MESVQLTSTAQVTPSLVSFARCFNEKANFLVFASCYTYIRFKLIGWMEQDHVQREDYIWSWARDLAAKNNDKAHTNAH